MSEGGVRSILDKSLVLTLRYIVGCQSESEPALCCLKEGRQKLR